jgi:hypothetical protein
VEEATDVSAELLFQQVQWKVKTDITSESTMMSSGLTATELVV